MERKVKIQADSLVQLERKCAVFDSERATMHSGPPGRRASPWIAKYYEQQFASKVWRQALFETVRGTKSHSVLDKLLAIHRPTLVICGQEDRIVDSDTVYDAVQYLPSFEFRMIPRCGHAPQRERPTLVNRMVLKFLKMRKL